MKTLIQQYKEDVEHYEGENDVIYGIKVGYLNSLKSSMDKEKEIYMQIDDNYYYNGGLNDMQKYLQEQYNLIENHE